MKNKLFMYLTAFLICLSDLTIKNFAEGKHVVLIPGLLKIDSVHNTGISFGMFSGSNLLILIITALLFAFLVFYAHRSLTRLFPHLLFGLILGGAAGNLLDRLLLGYVRDMIRFPFLDLSVFNLADAAIVCGCAILILCILFGRKEDKQNG